MASRRECLDYFIMEVYNNTHLSKESAGVILQHWLGGTVECRSIERLHGGMINSVLSLEFDQPHYQAVIKVSVEGADPFRHEAYTLEYLRAHSKLPVPELYLCKPARELVEQSFLLMEKLPGVNLGAAQMTPAERQEIDYHLADILIDLHGHERETFGELDGSKNYRQWLDYFEPVIRENYEDAISKLTPRAREIIPHLLDRMQAIFASQSRPTLIHGDIWITNVMVDFKNGKWRVTGLVDTPASRYADVEYELAYLEVFSTVTDAFFKRYCQARALRDGYEIRRLYYWLNTLLLHVWLFGDSHYVMRTEKIAEVLWRAI